MLCLSQALTKSGQKWLGSLLQLPGSDRSSAARIDANGSGQREEDSRAASSGIAAVVSSLRLRTALSAENSLLLRQSCFSEADSSKDDN